ncbi:conjugal transfer protein TraY [Salmonella enterica subsp. enterica serovar Lexington]|uniref:Relaxosome protein TraY n=1 Tax=Salmonella newport TaxID=108619 RepID=A0A636IKQ0_SALNE|nr:conjugal transfer protein TraY [Salmonella enterica subsp. enterica serovar Lexington]EAA5922508.1 conjugal transfer protein TraY [Salmonella enterica]EAA7937142.1 TraY domain-containing protein [Salmonella enterica subsp. enterica serovar Teko]EBZ4937793.1 TraY domain-containing protein [Salmonella enterica subsp. enterica serovar Java]EDI0448426.1 conjugal transfer protein TraY [Salmonella enterica subsp. enterica serovar Newport]EDV9143072.1 TraY domain-containing protein [Salmonella ent
MNRRNARSAPGNKILLNLDDSTNHKLLDARERSGRTKTTEALLRLRDHLSKYPDFYNAETDMEVTTQKN